ncbi:lycopene cyclase [Actinomadura rubrobrunea]|uniref:Lycopene cyclase n=1 Tax=Actinomadura rubrobrunea TaxID=115335 RepID=A0A9W6UZK5_9ACTN|nr:lycopene cyclase family protein [Actinomadura rubrobrunea]GLW66875.1 lycopene cyclase [Actinomadura rubrobrunea]
MDESDVIIVGAGAAGLSLAYHLVAMDDSGTPPTVTLVDAVDEALRPPDRTWCFWEEGAGEFEDAVAASWGRLRVLGGDGTEASGRTRPYRYKMISSTGFRDLVERRLAGRPEVRVVRADVDAVRDVPGGAEVGGTAAGGRRLTMRARWVFDSRPPRLLPRARTALAQHFRGWFVRAESPVFDPDAVVLMDFRTPQPPRGVSFGYVLPFGPAEALVEYTEFSPAPLNRDAYEQRLRHYTRDILRLGPLRVDGCEQGVIPMTDALFPRRVGRSVFRIGTAGGATRPATGYTFAAVQRQSRAIAAAYRRGAVPVPPAPYSIRARAMDAVLLRLLARGRADGGQFFTDLFKGVQTARLLRFLDGDTSLWEDIAIGMHTPVVPMLRTAVEVPLLPRRDLPVRPLRAPSPDRVAGPQGAEP